jgi:hypothetical protein
VVGASVNYSPEFSEAQPNLNLLQRLAEKIHGGPLHDAITPLIDQMNDDRSARAEGAGSSEGPGGERQKTHL